MEPLHVPDGVGEKLVFPGAIELTILVPGSATAARFPCSRIWCIRG